MFRSRWRPARAFSFVGVIAILLLSSCEATTDVAIDVAPDGSGTVAVTLTLDAEAAARLGGDLGAVVRLDDLKSAGWSLKGPDQDGDETTFSMAKSFSNPEALTPIIDEISGPDGPFQDFKLATASRLTENSYALTGKFELTGSLDQFSDSAVADALDGFATGRSPEELEQELAANPKGLWLGLTVHMPGELEYVAGGSSTEYAQRSELGTGVPQAAVLDLKSRDRDIAPVLWVIGGAACLGAAGLVLLTRSKPSVSAETTVAETAAAETTSESDVGTNG